MTPTTAGHEKQCATDVSEQSCQSYRDLFHHMNEGLAFCKMIFAEDERLDFVYLDVNASFEALTGLRNVVGRRVSEVIPDIQELDPGLLRLYARVARTGIPDKFEIFVAALQMWFSVSVYSPKTGHFVAVFDVITERIEVQKSLRESEEALRALFEDAPILYHEIDREGTVLRVNRTECDVLGVTAAEMIGHKIWEFVVPEEREAARAGIARNLLGPDVPASRERRFFSRTHGEMTFQLHHRLIRSPEGAVSGIRTAMIDQTETRRLNDHLARERQLLQALMDQSPDHIYFKDVEGRFELVNAATARDLGCGDPAALVGKTDFDIFKPEHAESANRDEQDLLRERVPVVTKEEKEIRHDGRETWALTTKLPLRDPSGKIVGTFGISRDVTERRRMEQAFRASEDRLKLAQEALDLGTWEVDLATDQGTCSEKLMQLYGRPGETMNGGKWASSVHPDDRERVMAGFRESLKTGEPLNRRFRVVWPEGSVHWLHSISRVIRNGEDQPVRVVGIDFDITELARTEDRLRILSTAVEQSPVSIVITDLHGNIEYVNPKTTEVTGYTAEELIGRNPRLLKSGETSAEGYHNLWHTIQSGEWRGIFHNRRKDGGLFWEAAVIRPIRDAVGAPTHYLAVKEDITERKATEEALRLSEERFRIAAENAGDIVFEWDLETGQFDFPNASVWETFLLDDRPANKDEWFRLIHPEDLDHMVTAAQRHITQHEPLNHEYRIVQRDGSVLDVVVRARVVGNPQTGKFKSIGRVTNITERRRADRVNAELAAIVESADAAIYSRDITGKVLTWNAGAERMYGYKPEEMIGRSLSILVPPDRASEAQNMDEGLWSGHQIRHLETLRLTKKGEPIPVFVSASPVRNRHGQVVGAAHVAWDVSELKLLQQQLAQAQKLESIGQLAAGIAHEINTPVQYIGDNAHFLSTAFQDLLGVIDRRQPPETDADLDYLRNEIPNAIGQMQEGVDRVAGIVRAMKRFSHPGPVEKLPMDINQAIESTVLVSRNEWKYVAELTTDLDPSMPLVPCIAGEFNQVILNLIVNAAHAIADVSKDPGAKGAIRIRTRKMAGRAEIRLADTGGGIPEAIRPKVFDPFFTTKPVGKGTGQGLAIAHSVIVQKHKGSIEFESETGKGTTFVIQLPLEDEKLQ